MNKFLEYSLWGNPVESWLIAFGFFVLSLVALSVFRNRGLTRLSRWAKSTSFTFDDLVVETAKQTRFFTLIALSLYWGSLCLTLDKNIRNMSGKILFLILLLQIAIWGQHLVQTLVRSIMKRSLAENADSAPTISFAGFLIKVILWSSMLLLALDNLGFDVTSLIAGLGVGGVAIALASQKILEDLFSSLSIILDKPFVNGDFVIVDDLMGTVEHIGLKTTRVRSLSGEQLVFSNSDLLTSRIRNFKRMYERRVVFQIGVVYETLRDKLEKIPQIIQSRIEKQELARFDRSHFASYGDFSLNFETVYFVKVPDYNTHMDIQQNILLGIFAEFQKEKIEFAFQLSCTM